jgi:hypothetical protein
MSKCWLVTAALLLFEGPAWAKPNWEDGETIRRHFAAGVTLLKEQGFGLLLRGRFNHFGVEASGGGNPYLLLITGGCSEVTVGFAPHVTLSLLAFFNGEEKFFQSGLRAAGIWDGTFGFGGMLGYVGELSFTKLLALQIGVGIQIYPEGEKKPKEIVAERCNAAVDLSPLTTIAQPYFGVNLLFYFL